MASLNQPSVQQNPRRSPVKVALLSLPPRTQSLLEFFFANAGRGTFVATPEESAEAAIFDLDTPGSCEHWQSFHARTGLAGLALAVKSQTVSGAIWLQKPVTPAALLAAAASLRESAFPQPVDLAGHAVPSASAAESVSAKPPDSAESGQAAVVPEPEPASETIPSATVQATAPQVQEEPSAQSDATPQSPGPVISDLPQAIPETVAVASPGEPKPTWSQKSSMELRITGFMASLRKLFASPIPVDDWSKETSRSKQTPGGPGVTPEPETIAAGPDAVEPETNPELTQPGPAMATAPEHHAQVEESDDGRAAQALSAPKSVSVDLPDGQAPSTAPSSHAWAESPEPTKEPSSEEPVAEPVVAAAGSSDAQSTADAAATRHGPQPELNEEHRKYFGARADVSVEDLLTNADLHYDPEQYLVGALREAYLVAKKWQVPTQFECIHGTVVVDAERNELHTSFDVSLLDALASQPLEARSKVVTLSRGDLDRFSAHETAREGRVPHVRLDDQLWRAGLLASGGRIPLNTEVRQRHYLQHWPNLTRLTPIPHAARISALWAMRGASLLETVEQLSIEQRYVIGVYNAAWALNLITSNGSHLRDAQRRNARNRGLLTRLLGWLRG